MVHIVTPVVDEASFVPAAFPMTAPIPTVVPVIFIVPALTVLEIKSSAFSPAFVAPQIPPLRAPREAVPVKVALILPVNKQLSIILL